MASAARSIPVLHDAPAAEGALLSSGPRHLKYEALAPHPVQTIQELHDVNAWNADLYRAERVYGMAAAWEKRMERAAFSQVRRLPGLPSSFCALDTISGRDYRIGFEDVLGVPEASPALPSLSVHTAMERRLGM